MHVPNYCEIIPCLFVSGDEAATHHALHHSMKFSLVVNCTNHSPFLKPRNKYTTYIQLRVEDNLKAKEIRKMQQCLPYAIQLLHMHLSKGNNVLVHCLQGKQRSATIIAAYIMWSQNVSCNTAIKMVQEKRQCAFTPDVNFIQCLRWYETVQHLLSMDKSLHTKTAC